MPPLPGQKGTGKKGRDVRQSRSRNSTPSLLGGARSSVPPIESGETSLLELPTEKFRAADDVDEYGPTIPNSKGLESLLESLSKLAAVVDQRGIVCDRGMRILAQARKERSEDLENQRRDEERRERMKRDAAGEEERGRNKANKIKKRKDISTSREERPLTHGAHGLAPQDGSNLESSPTQDINKRKIARPRSRDSASSSLSPVIATPAATGMDIDDKEEKIKDDEEDTSSDEHQPPPAPAIPHHQTFGEDPSTFPDPTVYEVRKCWADMDADQRREYSSVAIFPKDDLEKMIPGVAPDKDFSNAKPTNQVQFNTFSTYCEPYFRPFTEEDLAFLRERGDRTTPFVIPRRGKKHYTEVWGDEDGLSVDMPTQGKDKLPPNLPRGNLEDLDDATAETDQVSAGPILSRLLATMRPEHRAPASEEKPTTNGLINGESSIDGEANGDLGDPGRFLLPDAPAPLPPASYMTDSSSEAWKKASHPKLDHAQVDERIKQELRHLGFLPQDTEPDYDAHYDDEIAARLRFLQEKLKEQCNTNGARKARLQELVKERMAHQEYTTILEDLDGQVQTAYLKRTRTMGKSKKAKRPGGAGGGSHFVAGAGANGMARPGIGDMTKTLMERRSKWINNVGRVFENERSIIDVPRDEVEGSSIFKSEDMAEYVKRESELWDEDGEEE